MFKMNKDRLLGTISYFSPEMIMDENHVDDGGSDYWALGIVIYFVYTKTRPFDDGDILDNIISYNVNWEKLQKTKISPLLLDLTQQLMAFNPNERLKSLKKIKAHSYFEGINKL